jgi:hypothetical protein
MTLDDLKQALPSAAKAVAWSGADQTFSPATRRLYIGVSGDVKVDLEDSGQGIVFKAVPVGMLDVRASKIYAAGTTATNIVALN